MTSNPAWKRSNRISDEAHRERMVARRKRQRALFPGAVTWAQHMMGR